MMATVYTCILLISWLGARMIVLSGATSFTTGELMSMLTYCTNILTSLMIAVHGVHHDLHVRRFRQACG